MCDHLQVASADNSDPVIVFGCGATRAAETGCSATFGKRPWLGIGNGYYIQKVATFTNDAVQQQFRDHLDAFLDRVGVHKEES